jgi:hypothetical protein
MGFSGFPFRYEVCNVNDADGCKERSATDFFTEKATGQSRERQRGSRDGDRIRKSQRFLNADQSKAITRCAALSKGNYACMGSGKGGGFLRYLFMITTI